MYELATPRTITADDMQYGLKLAMPLRNADEIVVIRLEWEINGLKVECPAGKFGSRLTADLDLLLAGG